MGYVRWTLGVVIALTLALPASASADIGPFDRPVTDPDAVRALEVTRAYWGSDLPCAQMLWDTGRDVAAEAYECTIYVFPTWLEQGRVRRCETIVHEYGHLLGYGHTRGLDSVMSPIRRTGIVPGCVYPKGITIRPERLARRGALSIRRSPS